MSKKIMQVGIKDIFDVFMLLCGISIIAAEWLDLPVHGWHRITIAVLLSAIGSLSGFLIYKKFRGAS
jgi:hypothetical protein